MTYHTILVVKLHVSVHISSELVFMVALCNRVDHYIFMLFMAAL